MGTVTYQSKGLETWDILVVVLYLIVILGIGIYSTIKSRRNTVSGYFLAGRFMTWLPVGASVFASNIGSEHFIGMAGSGAASGIGVAAFNTSAMILLPFFGFVFMPVYIASGISTMPEYIHKRFGGKRIRIWLSTLSLLLYIFAKISVNLYASALFIRLALGWNLYLAILVVLFITFLCTVAGGLTAVIYTDTLCTFLMTVGSLIVMGLGFSEVGGYSGLKEKYMTAVSNETLYSNSSCGRPRADSFVMLRDPVDSDIPWAGLIFGQTFSSIWYWCADQVIVQRVLASKSLSHAQGGCIFAAYIKILPLFTLVMPGMISRVLSPDRVACSVPEKCMEICGNSLGCTNIAYPEIVMKLMPTGLRGLMMAVMLAALMSDLTSIFNSASTLFTIDIYTVFRKKPTVREMMVVGRIMVAVMAGIGILWIPVIQSVQGGQLFYYIMAISAYFSPPISALYLIAVFWTKATEKGAFWGMIIGFIVGITRMALDFAYRKPGCGEPDTRPAIIKFHFTYFALMLVFLTGIVIVIISLFTKPSKGANTAGMTWWTRYDKQPGIKTMPEDDGEITIELKEKNDVNENEEERNPPLIVFKQKTCWKNFLNWFCGHSISNEEALKDKEEQKRMAVITSLEQDPRAKIFLYVNAAISLIIGFFLYLYYTF